MGRPKALLAGPEGIPLAARQAAALREGGSDPVAVVVGSQAPEVRAGLPADIATVENPRWAQGRATSLQASCGVSGGGGLFVLPVDAAGVKAGTVRAVLAAAAPGIRSRCGVRCIGAKGHSVEVPRGAAQELLGLAADARVDEWAKPLARGWRGGGSGRSAQHRTPGEWRSRKTGNSGKQEEGRGRVGGRRADDGGRRTEGRGQRGGGNIQYSNSISNIQGDRRGPRSEVRGPRSEVRGPRSEVRGRKSEVRLTTINHPPSTIIQRPPTRG